MAIFDKSFIHGITTEEAAVFDMHFITNLTPLFFVEVLADLEKSSLDETRFNPDSFIGALIERAHLGMAAMADPAEESLSPEVARALVTRLTAAAQAPPPDSMADLSEEDVTTTFVRSVPMRRGRLQIVPKGARS